MSAITHLSIFSFAIEFTHDESKEQVGRKKAETPEKSDAR